jgi:hypothetical protein
VTETRAVRETEKSGETDFEGKALFDSVAFIVVSGVFVDENTLVLVTVPPSIEAEFIRVENADALAVFVPFIVSDARALAVDVLDTLDVVVDDTVTFTVTVNDEIADCVPVTFGDAVLVAVAEDDAVSLREKRSLTETLADALAEFTLVGTAVSGANRDCMGEFVCEGEFVDVLDSRDEADDDATARLLTETTAVPDDEREFATVFVSDRETSILNVGRPEAESVVTADSKALAVASNVVLGRLVTVRNEVPDD